MKRFKTSWLAFVGPLLLLAACSTAGGPTFTLAFSGDTLSVHRGATIDLDYRASGAAVQSVRYKFDHQSASSTINLTQSVGRVSIAVPSDMPLSGGVLQASLISDGVAVRQASVNVSIVDQGAPRVTWMSPEWGARIAGTVQMRVEATDDTGIAMVEFLINDQVLAESSTGIATVNTTNLPNGTVVITARATDLAGNVTSAVRTFQIGNVGVNVPMITWELPYSYQAFIPGETITMAVDVSDASGSLAMVRFFINQDVVHTVTNITDAASAKTISFDWDGFDTVVGPVVLRAEATNGFGGMSSALRNIVVVSPQAPEVDRTKPLVWWDRDYVWNNKVVWRTIDLGIVAQDNVAVAYFDWYLNNAHVARIDIDQDETRNPTFYKVWPWNTLTVPDGVHTLRVEAVDTSGNRSDAQSVNLVVRNGAQAPVDTERPTVWWDEEYVWGGKVFNNDWGSDRRLGIVAEDNVAVSYFDVFLNGSWVFRMNANGSRVQGKLRYANTWDWDTREYPDGNYTWGVEAVDSSGNRSIRSSVQVVIRNAPGIAWDVTSVWNGKVLSGYDVPIRIVQVSTPQDVYPWTEFDFYINGAFAFRQDAAGLWNNAGAYRWFWDTLQWPDGEYEIRAFARDEIGNISNVITVNVIVRNAPVIEFDDDYIHTGGYVYIANPSNNPEGGIGQGAYYVCLGVVILSPADSDDLYFDFYVNDMFEKRVWLDDSYLNNGGDCDDGDVTRVGEGRRYVQFYWPIALVDLAGPYKLSVQAYDRWGKTSERVHQNVMLDTMRYLFRTTIAGYDAGAGTGYEFRWDTSPVDIVVTLEGNLDPQAVCRVQLMLGGSGLGNDGDWLEFPVWYYASSLLNFNRWQYGYNGYYYWYHAPEAFIFQYAGNKQWRLNWNPAVPLRYNDNGLFGSADLGALAHNPERAWHRYEGDEFWEFNNDYTRYYGNNLGDRYLGARIWLCAADGNEDRLSYDRNRYHDAVLLTIPYRERAGVGQNYTHTLND
jgi:hypothetical protein